jgi:hypothetical protein
VEVLAIAGFALSSVDERKDSAGITSDTYQILPSSHQNIYSDEQEIRDLRALRGVGADAVDTLDRFYELKIYAGMEPDRIELQDSQIRRAMSTPDFFLVVVSELEWENASPNVRIIIDPLSQLSMSESSSVTFAGVRSSQSVVYQFEREG